MNSLKISKVASAPLFACMICCAAACGGNRGQSPSGGSKCECVECTDEDCDKDSCTCMENTVSSRPESPERPESSIFLMDISKSMKGYFGSGDSRLLGVVNSYLNLAVSEPAIHWFGESETNGVARTDFVNITQSSIDWSNESDIRAMLQSMVEHTNDYDISFLLTDGILSGSNEQIRNSNERKFNIEKREWMAGEIRNIFEGKDTLSAILIRYIAGFNGTYSCYNNDSKLLNKYERPYYIVVVGKWKYVKYIEEHLRSGKSKPYDFYAMFGDEQTYKGVRFSYRDGVRKMDADGSLVIKGDVRRDGDVVLSADITVLPDYMRTAEYWKKHLRLYVQEENHPEKELMPDVFSVSIDTVSSSKIVCCLSVRASSLLGRALVVKVGYESPSWIEECTDYDDLDIRSNPRKMNMTFNLKYLAEGFKGLQNEEYVIYQTIKFK